MNTLLLIVIIVTCLISYYGLQNFSVFEKYKFNVAAVNSKKEYLRLLSAGFLHADFMHLAMNMLTLYFFAPIVIMVFGELNFILIYLGSILFGNLFTLFYYKNKPWYSAIGASGGVAGILFAAVAIDPVEISVNFIPGFIFGALYFGYSVYQMMNPNVQDNIGHAAHLGGAFFGLVYVLILAPVLIVEHSWQLGVMALPLFYLAYQIFVNKKIG